MSDNKTYILVVEDNLLAMKAAGLFFKLAGCVVAYAKDGSEAVAMATTNQYDGICMDIGLPIFNGIEACKKIREYELKHHLKPVPIIAVTANTAEEEKKRYFAAGMQAVLSKPLTEDKTREFLSYCREGQK